MLPESEYSLRETLIKSVLAELDMYGEVEDSEVKKAIDKCIMQYDGKIYIPLKEKVSLKQDIFNSIRRFDVISELIDDDNISEIMINGYRDIYIEENGVITKYGKSFENEERLFSVIQQITAGCNRRVNESEPIADASLSDGSRVNIVLNPVSLDGPAVTIRKFPKRIMNMKQLENLGALTPDISYFLNLLVRSGYNIFISGGTGAGKTTFLNALSEYIPKTERLITIEDSAELQINGISNLIRLETRNANVEGKNRITIRDLIKTSLRMRPDRIIVGEVRDDAAIDMLSAMNTGHSGSISTGHANSARDMLFRLETMVLMGMEIPIEAVRRQISSALDIIIHLGRMRDKTRKVIEISEVMGMTNGEINLNTLYKFEETAAYGSKVKGELVKYNELADTSKLASAGLLGIYRESDLCSMKS